MQDGARRREAWRRFGLARGHYALVTLHRPANVDDDEQLARIVEGLAQLARRVPVVFAIHPRTRERLSAMGDEERLRLAGVRCTPPLRYADFVSLELGAGAVVTDSGTVQEETSALGVPLLHAARLDRADGDARARHQHAARRRPARARRRARSNRVDAIPRELPHWDGRSGARVAALLVERYAERSATAGPSSG